MYRKANRREKNYLPSRKCITKTHLYNSDPLKPHFYIVKLGLHGCTFFSYFCSKHRLWVFIRTASSRWFLRVPTIYVWSRNMKNIRVFLSEKFQFLEMKFPIYLNRRVFVMDSQYTKCIDSIYLNPCSAEPGYTLPLQTV